MLMNIRSGKLMESALYRIQQFDLSYLSSSNVSTSIIHLDPIVKVSHFLASKERPVISAHTDISTKE